MNNYFGINLEFDKSVIDQILLNALSNNEKGYVCIVDGNVLVNTYNNADYKSIINSSLVNTCDGSSIAWLAGKLHKKKFKPFNGPDFFNQYIEKPYNHIFVGNTSRVVDGIKEVLITQNKYYNNTTHISLPFLEVEEFDYFKVASTINNLNPQFIWVSLGAPKQEIFMSKLMPLINKGIMVGIGAAFNFYINEIKSPKISIGTLKFIWLYRLFKEPKKQFIRIIKYILIIPKICLLEKNKITNL